ncbi:uncharacterized protein LOC111624721 [Centruroides sculpturatus]|uniref:uncharacterized protein LOC111624721 n=1 Tax=Centruroides sculpturatus TaxID=218467 RepID=UPI000C6D82F2|nr:uncharacterized protein LOC111624721 [Centruroides sculpturatus]
MWKQRTQQNIGKLSNTLKAHSVTVLSCPVCKEAHHVFYCPAFQKQNVKTRKVTIKNAGLCFNCFKGNHSVKDCKSTSTCKHCRKKHNTMLHEDESPAQVSASNAASSCITANCNTSEVIITHHASETQQKTVLLATAVVNVIDSFGTKHKARLLLDNGSQSSFVSEAFVQRTRLPRETGKLRVIGLGQTDSGVTKGIVKLQLQSIYDQFSLQINAFVLPKLTGILPAVKVNISDWKHIKNIDLADSAFNKPREIDILLGADYYHDVLTSTPIVKESNRPYLQLTRFGWVVSGPVGQQLEDKVICNFVTCNTDKILKQFWEIEEVEATQKMSAEETKCEEHFQKTHRRQENGRYSVSFPFREERPTLGDSKQMAFRRLQALERRLEKDPYIRTQYNDFMKEYENKHHMSEVSTTEECYYIPHHCVIRESSETTKLRVVFDASAKSSNNKSLNEQICVGPKIQDDIFEILLRFRTWKIAISADIEKMFRQISMNNEDRRWQRILWRSSPELPVKEYELNTVTYGTTSGPYLATRTLKQLSIDEREHFPEASTVVERDFYVDDLMTGRDEGQEAVYLCQQLTEMLNKGQFYLRKWISNDRTVISALQQSESTDNHHIKVSDLTKALGLNWNTKEDIFYFVLCKFSSQPPTKRTVISDIARLFDPLGWLAPVTIKAKMMLQRLWTIGTTWDELLPTVIAEQWKGFRAELQTLTEIKIPRHAIDRKYPLQLHGFADASERAYAAVVYSRQRIQGEIVIKILCAKTKVAPLKVVTLPRLELCAIQLLAKLMHRVNQQLQINKEDIFAWSDSTIALSWIKSEPRNWKTFVANRVSEIQTYLPPQHWKHVKSKDNPADYASRGLNPATLNSCDQWWNGPKFLYDEEVTWKVNTINYYDVQEERKKTTVAFTGKTEIEDPLNIRKSSSWLKLQRILAYCRRFINNCKKEKKNRQIGQLTPTETKHSAICIIRHVQQVCFRDVFEAIKTNNSKHRLRALAPFVDEQCCLRVGGRLQNANISFDAKHPLLLPEKHHLTKIIVQYFHKLLLHPSINLLIAQIRQLFWIPHTRTSVKRYTKDCMACFRDRASEESQQMGVLPQYRVQQLRPFSKVGIDYAGPFPIKVSHGRTTKHWKSYLALFICMATKAVHLEVVSDLTTAAFIAALRRFTSRRGKPTDIFSDNGTNFVGANNELRELLQFLNKDSTKQEVISTSCNQGINWHFIPPHSPHFGGLWESNIKSAKKHMRRIIGNQILTYEELTTVFNQIEACLNSRPLTPISEDPNELSALTPAHFLLGEALTSLPEPDLQHIKLNRLSRWQLLQRMVQDIWKRWHLEYLSQLQNRPKWTEKRRNLQYNDLVLVKEKNIPHTKWILARIIKTHPGKDGHVRVVDIKTKDGLFTRNINQLCRLPENSSNLEI